MPRGVSASRVTTHGEPATGWRYLKLTGQACPGAVCPKTDQAHHPGASACCQPTGQYLSDPVTLVPGWVKAQGLPLGLVSCQWVKKQEQKTLDSRLSGDLERLGFLRNNCIEIQFTYHTAHRMGFSILQLRAPVSHCSPF